MLPALAGLARGDRLLELAGLARGDRLLVIARHGEPARGTANRWLARYRAGLRERGREVRRAPVKVLHDQAAITQKTLHNREIASKADFTFDVDARQGSSVRDFRGVQKGRWKQRTPEECNRVIFANPATTLRSIAESLRPKASSRHCTDLLYAGSATTILISFSCLKYLFANVLYPYHPYHLDFVLNYGGRPCDILLCFHGTTIQISVITPCEAPAC